MDSPIQGLHHVTATVDGAQADLDFCIETLGLRLVKKTVNFDNHLVYHFYYGDERGTPGTVWTTFPYRGHGVLVGSKGAGQITVTSFSVPSGSLDQWKARLKEHGVAAQDAPPRFGEQSIQCVDPSGLAIELVGTDRDQRQPWTRDLDANAAIRGLHSVTMTIASPPETIAFMKDLLGFKVIDEVEGRTRVGVNGDEPGKVIDIVHAPDAPKAHNGLGTVHHVAMAVPASDDQLRMRQELLKAGAKVTEVRDRQYFLSIYFREPGGVLFEIATVRPGFEVDEAAAWLGRDLKLPPWEEPHRSMLEAGLDKIQYR